MIKYEYNIRGLLSGKECSFSRSDAETLSYAKSTEGRQSFRTTYNYDNFDRITKVSSPAGEYAYTYDSKGRIASLSMASSVDSVPSVVKYSYDKAGRLVSKKFNDTPLCSY